MSAPTTAEVRALVQTAWADAQSDGPYRDNIYAQGSHGGRAEALESIALPIAEHRDAAVAERDALAAEVARLREALAASEARATKAEGVIAEALAVTEGMCGQPRATLAFALAGVRMALTSAAKGAGR